MLSESFVEIFKYFNRTRIEFDRYIQSIEEIIVYCNALLKEYKSGRLLTQGIPVIR
jgi:hypothetical protein